MATLGYTKLHDAFLLYHGNATRACLHYSKYENIGKIYLPMYSELEQVGEEKFYTVDDFYEQKMKNNQLYGDNFLYPRHNIRMLFGDELNDVRYAPIKIPTKCILQNDNIIGFNRTIDDILEFFEITQDYFNNMLNFMEKKKYTSIIIKNNIQLHISPIDCYKSVYSIIKGQPQEKYFEVQWKNRYKVNLSIEIPNYYKKILKHKYIGGTDGEIFVRAYYDFIYPNFFSIEPIKYKSLRDIPLITDYDTLSCLSAEQRFVKRKREIEKCLEQERLQREREENKHKDGYCHVCGSPNASWVVNPYYKEIYGEEILEWLCPDCYESSLGDI